MNKKPIELTEETSVSSWATTEVPFQQNKDQLLGQVSGAESAGVLFVYADQQLLKTALTRVRLFEKTPTMKGAI